MWGMSYQCVGAANMPLGPEKEFPKWDSQGTMSLERVSKGQSPLAGMSNADVIAKTKRILASRVPKYK